MVCQFIERHGFGLEGFEEITSGPGLPGLRSETRVPGVIDEGLAYGFKWVKMGSLVTSLMMMKAKKAMRTTNAAW